MPPAVAGSFGRGEEYSWGSRPAARDYAIPPLRGWKSNRSPEAGITEPSEMLDLVLS